jgi:MFS-type transporter involved in bile tolerance (Atg22 family)
MLVGAFTTWFQSQMAGLAAILILLAAGLAMMLTVREQAAG